MIGSDDVGVATTILAIDCKADKGKSTDAIGDRQQK